MAIKHFILSGIGYAPVSFFITDGLGTYSSGPIVTNIGIIFTHDDYTFQIQQAVTPYKTTIALPIDWQKSSNNLYYGFDHGSGYDVRFCDCKFIMTAAQGSDFVDFFSDNKKGRGKKITMTLVNESGFFPFGPDKGDKGIFTVYLEIQNHKIIHDVYLYYEVNCRIHNCGSYPVYTMPDQVDDSNNLFQIGPVSKLRFPPELFEPDTEYNQFAQIMEGGDAQIIDRQYGDQFESTLMLHCNESKAAALIYYLTTSARANQFSIISDSNFYIFGMDKGSSGTYNVKMINDKIEITHVNYNYFTFGLRLQNVG